MNEDDADSGPRASWGLQSNPPSTQVSLVFHHLAILLLFILLAAASFPAYILLIKSAASKVLFTIHDCILISMLVPILEVNVSLE